MKTTAAYVYVLYTMAISSAMGQAPLYKDPELDPRLNPNLRGRAAIPKKEGPVAQIASAVESEVIAAAVEVKDTFAEAALKAQELLADAKPKVESATAEIEREAVVAQADTVATEIVANAESATKSAISQIIADVSKNAASEIAADAPPSTTAATIVAEVKSVTAEIAADAKGATAAEIVNVSPAKTASTALTDPKTVEVKRSVQEAKKHDVSKKSKRRFVKYESSYWERLWVEQVDEWAKEHKICEILLGEQAQMVHDFLNGTCTSRYLPPHDSWCMIDDEYRPLWYNSGNRDEFEFSWIPPFSVDARVAPPKPVIPNAENAHIFSKFTFKDEETGEEYAEYIEPLVSHLRFPLTHCIDPTPNEPAYKCKLYERTDVDPRHLSFTQTIVAVAFRSLHNFPWMDRSSSTANLAEELQARHLF